MLMGNDGEYHTVYLTSNTFHCVEEKYSSSEDEGYEYDVSNQRYNVHMAEQQVFSDSKEDYTEPHFVEMPTQCSMRKLTKEEIERLTIVAVEEAKSKYWLRNRIVNEKEGVPRGIFKKDQKVTQGISKKIENKQHDKSEQKPVQKEEVKELHKELQKTDQLSKREKEENKGETSKQKKIIKAEGSSFDFTQALSQVKMSIPLLEMMKIKEYRDSVVQLITNGNEKHMNYENEVATKTISRQEKGNIPEVYLSDVLTNSPQVDPFFTTLLINKKLLRNCMIDSGAAINIMLVGVMKQLSMWVDTNGGKCYAMDNKPVPVVGIMKYVEVKLATYPQVAYNIDITVIDTPPRFGMLLSRQ